MFEKNFVKFEHIIEERLQRNLYTTEDSIRYLFFATLLSENEYDPNDFILEYPHTMINNAKIDTYILPKTEAGIAIEFKYDRVIPSKKNSPTPQKAGKIFNDIFRLAQFQANEGDKRLFVYLTDYEMKAYLKNTKNKLTDFFMLKVGKKMEIDAAFINQHAATFVKNVDLDINCKVSCIFSAELSKEHALRVFEVC